MDTDLPLRQALNAVGEAIFMTDRDGVFTYVNGEFERLYGYLAIEVVGHCTPRILKSGHTPPDGYVTWWTRLNRGESIVETFVNRTRDGRLVEVEISANPIRSDLNEIVGFLAIQRDVTGRTLAEGALRRSEARCRALADTAIDAVFIVDDENRFEYINASAARYVGESKESLIGRDLQDCFGLEVGRILEERIEQVRQRRKAAFDERQIQFPTGPRWMGTWLHLIDTGDCSSGSVMGMARDTSSQHEMAELLERQNVLLNSVINASPVGIVLFHADAWVCDVANLAAREFGASGLDAGVKLSDGWPDAVTQLVPLLGLALQSTGPVHADIELSNASHQNGPSIVRRFTVSASRLQLPQRAPSVLAMLTEITERHQLEEQLMQAQKMEAVGRLAGGIAHDFNNLLTPILGYSDLVLNTFAASDERRQDVEEVCRAAKSAAALTRQLLTFSRKQVTEPVILNLNSVLDDVEKILRRSIGEDVDVVQQHEPHLGSIRADRNQLEQVVMNLSVNARDAMPTGGVLTIATANHRLTETERGTPRQIPPGEYVVLSVADTGTGMTQDVLAHLFEPFYTTKEFGKGTGLGLSTVFGIVNQSGGYISVASALGEGTTFTIYFPCVESGAAPHEAPNPHSTADLPRGGETVLIVEDNDALKRLAHRVLTDLGYVTLVAANADEALRIDSDYQAPIHLLLTDIVMPGVDGITLSRRIAARHANTRVLFMSGYSGRDIAERDMPTDRVNLLQKPFTRETLARAVRTALDENVVSPVT